MAKNQNKPIGRALSAEDVLKREIDRFEARAKRARADAEEAEAEAARMRRALAALEEPMPDAGTPVDEPVRPGS